ncbi:MAG: AhpC/TSA family protein [Paludibacter sp.]|nr:AhpC/TSA family protein [Paludibacter sp.]
MKRIIISLLSVSLSFGAFAQGGKKFVIKGTLKNVEDGTVFQLMKQEGRLGISVCSDTVRNGKFTLKWTVVDGTEKYSLSPDTKEIGFPPMGLDIWVKSGSVIEVTGKNKWFYTWEIKSDIPEQIERNRFVVANAANWNEIQALLVESTTLSKKNLTISEKKNLTDSLNRLTQVTLKKIFLNDIELFKQKPITTSAGVEVLGMAVSVMKEENETTKLSELKLCYNQLSKYQKETIEANNIYSILYPSKKVKVGDIMADGELFDLSDNKHSLSEYKGKYLLLDFWSDGCSACIQALPKLAKIYEKQRDTLNIIGINMNTPSVWKKRNKINQISWVNLNDKKEYSGLATKYGLRAMPLYVFISPEGKILFSTSYWEELENKMKEYIND